ncbi:hypothetical protein T484DRAFT_2543028 [Baffinella frigidus]|nr:hypothetical protein T484DRAFT_2543028 [Cryptophyta sp. CCMP2293]
MDFEELVIFSTKPGQGPHPHTVRGGDAGSARWVRALGAGQFHEDATGGLRVAGDIHITLYHHSQGLNKKKEKVCHFWLHSGFMLNPPAEMGGTLRKISQEQLASLASEAGAHTSDEAAFSHRFHLEKHPGGCFALCLQKHEIDGAAGAKNSSRFADDFSVTLLFEALHETVGTGTALTNAERFARSKGGGFLSGASSQNAELALRTYQDKLEYMMVKQTGTMSRLSSLRAANSPGAWRSSPPSSASTPAAAGCGTAVPRVPSYEAWLTTASRMAAVPLWDMDTIRHTIESLDLEAGRETRAATLRKENHELAVFREKHARAVSHFS